MAMKMPASVPEPATTGSTVEVTVTATATADAAQAEPSFDPSITARAVATAELRRLLALWQRHEAGARLGQDPEELHQLRVVVRRIDATLGLFKRQLPAALVRARKTTKAVLRSLGAARDLDVQLSELGEYCAGLSERERAAAEPLQVYLESERERARARMLRALDSEPTRRWLELLRQASAESGEHQGTDPAMAVMPERVRRRFRKLRRSVGELRAKSSMEDYHQVRRRAKQLRYATECGAAMFGKPADELLRALRRLQERLGAQQDAYMAQNRLAALAAEPASGLPPATLFLMGRLAERHARVTARARRTLDRSWRRVRGRRWKALRARLEQLSESAVRLHEMRSPGLDTEEIAPLPLATATQPPAPESRQVKH
jgi:CHAD domain-containing protein